MDQSTNQDELLENLEHILSTIRHEVGDVANSLKITLDVLKENFDLFDDRKKKDYLERSSQIIQRQQRLIDAMKSYSRFNVKKQKEVPFSPFWEHFLKMAKEQLREKNIKLIHHFPVEPCKISGDSMALDHVLTNILNNAAEALEDIENPTAELMALKEGSSVIIQIKDNGPGIKRKDLPKIFIPLFSTKPGRMGMGLPIARKLLWNMKGGIIVESSFGQGTEVRLWLKAINGNGK